MLQRGRVLVRAEFFFTRIASPERVNNHVGWYSKKIASPGPMPVLTKETAFALCGPWAKTPTRQTPKNRAASRWPTTNAWQKLSNETILKNGLHLLDDNHIIRTSSQAERQTILQIFAKHGISTLPDGRNINDGIK